MIVSIDGPAGAGKSTVARRVASELGLTYIDTGAMYRAVAWLALREGVSPENETALAALAQKMSLRLSPLSPEGLQHVWVGSDDITTAIRTPEVSSLTSEISAIPALRHVIVEQQRQLARDSARGAVLEGRDIGTVVFPDADVKVFLTATPEERARRRAAELRARGLDVNDAQVLAEQSERDARDSQRADSPLLAAPDAVIIDTDGLTIDEVVERILALCR